MLKKSIVKIISVILLTFVPLSLYAYKDVHVKGYFRSDGTYVKGHFRSEPSSSSGGYISSIVPRYCDSYRDGIHLGYEYSKEKLNNKYNKLIEEARKKYDEKKINPYLYRAGGLRGGSEGSNKIMKQQEEKKKDEIKRLENDLKDKLKKNIECKKAREDLKKFLDIQVKGTERDLKAVQTYNRVVEKMFDKTKCNKKGKVYINGKCLTHNENCQSMFGKNVLGYKKRFEENKSSCYCKKGYKFNHKKDICEAEAKKEEVKKYYTYNGKQYSEQEYINLLISIVEKLQEQLKTKPVK